MLISKLIKNPVDKTGFLCYNWFIKWRRKEVKQMKELDDLKLQNEKIGKLILTNIDWYDIIHISVGGRIWTIKFYKKKNITVKVLNGF